MEKSDHFYRRKKHMNPLIAPTITEVKDELGDKLAEVFFATCPESLRSLVGLEPLLNGTTGDLWMSPSDVLIGRVCLTPPFTEKCTKALTHQGILLIGEDIEQKLKNETELQRQRGLFEQEEVLLFSADMKCKKSIEDAIQAEQNKCAKEKEEIEKELSDKHIRELWQLEFRLKKEFEKTLRKQAHNLNNQWQDKLVEEIDVAVRELTKTFMKEFAKQEEESYKKFSLELKKEKLKHQFDLQEVRKTCQESFAQLKHQLECKNIANIMYILCAERQKCREETKITEHSYQKRIEHLQDVVADKDVEIVRLNKEMDEKLKELDKREQCLKELLCQYQKFIYFALRSCPTQAEFLLDPEKLLLFELTHYFPQIISKHGKKLCKEILPWKTESKSNESLDKESIVAKDYHKCYNEIDPPISETSRKSNEYLPALHYNKHMYVREEFRNMMSCGLEVAPNNLIWNEDVEHLMHVLRRTGDEPKVPSEICSSERSVNSSVKAPHTTPVKNEQFLHISDEAEYQSSVTSEDMLCPVFDDPCKFLVTETKCRLQELSSATHRKSDTSLLQTIKPCCTRCTQTYIKRPWHKLNVSVENLSHSVVDHPYPKDSLIKYRMSLKQSRKEKEEDITLSKLSLARDSIIVHKHSLEVKRKQRAVDAMLDDRHLCKQTKTSHRMGTNLSKLSLSKDSLELLRSQSMLPKRKIESKESIEIKNGIVGGHVIEDSRSVKVSHMEILPLDEKPKKQKSCTRETDSDTSTTNSPWLTYAYKNKDFVKQAELEKSNIAKIMGDRDIKLHMENNKILLYTELRLC
ncbi:hypothetical protein FQR65_LT06500 [Abscondita terminalis]|nr:hypothetical protein FQR65_LT06500 [Abscondita terminalis]